MEMIMKTMKYEIRILQTHGVISLKVIKEHQQRPQKWRRPFHGLETILVQLMLHLQVTFLQIAALHGSILFKKIHDKPKKIDNGYAVKDVIRVFRNDRFKTEGEECDSAYNESLA
jgi:hypothetical protein